MGIFLVYQLLIALIHDTETEQLMRRIGQVWLAVGPTGIALWMPYLQPLELAGLKAGPIAGWRAAVAIARQAGYDLDLEPSGFGATLEGVPGEWLIWPANPAVRPVPDTVPYRRTWSTDVIGAHTVTFTRSADAPGGEVLYPSRLECYVAFNTETAAHHIEELVTA